MRKARIYYARVDEYWKKEQKFQRTIGITNALNRLDDEGYIVQLIEKVITVSLEIVEILEIVEGLLDISLLKEQEVG